MCKIIASRRGINQRDHYHSTHLFVDDFENYWVVAKLVDFVEFVASIALISDCWMSAAVVGVVAEYCNKFYDDRSPPWSDGIVTFGCAMVLNSQIDGPVASYRDAINRPIGNHSVMRRLRLHVHALTQTHKHIGL